MSDLPLPQLLIWEWFTMMQGFTHIDGKGNARMVDVSAKPDTKRIAIAQGRIYLNAKTMELLENQALPKGDVLSCARIAGIMATKQTANLIPLCHPLFLSHVALDIVTLKDECAIEVRCTTETLGKTGVEMEALTGVTVALLTIYDMCKAFDRGMRLEGIGLQMKDGGASGYYTARV